MKSLYSFLSRVNSASNVKLSASAATNPTENLLKKFILRTAGVVALFLFLGGSVKGQTTIWSENFDVTPTTWNVLGNFAVGAPGSSNVVTAPRSASKVLATVLNGDYSKNRSESNQYAISPVINCSGYSSITLNYYSYSIFETCCDYGRVYYSIDNGSTWLAFVEEVGSVQESSYTSHTLSLPSASNASQLKLKFTLNSDASVQYTGWNIDDLTITGYAPAISAPASLNSISSCLGFVSSSQSFNVSGSYMLSGITASAPTGYEVSTDNINFNSSVTIGTAGTIVSTAVYVRLNSSATGTPSGNIVLSSSGATSQNVAVSGTVIPSPTIVTVSSAGTYCSSTTLTASNGSDGTIYWQGTSSAGTSTGTPSTSQTVTASGTYYFRAKSGAGCWGPVGSAAVLINAPVAITAQPSTSPLSTCAGTAFASLSVTATGTSLTYQWQQSTDGVNSWASVASSGTSASYTPQNATAGTLYYRCIVAGASPCTSVTSDPSGARTVNPLPTIVTVSSAGTYCSSTTLTASNGSDGTIYWQGTSSAGTSTGTPSTSQTVTASGTYYFRAQSGAGCWGPVGSAAVLINAPVAITAQPSTSPLSTCAGTAFASLSVTATGTSLTYQWQQSTDGVNSWTSVASSGTSASYTPPNATAGTLYYRCIVSGASPCTSVTSDPSGARTVNSIPTAPVLTASTQNFCGSGGSTEIIASGSQGTYSWTALEGSPSLSSSSGSIINVTVTQTSAIQVVATSQSCASSPSVLSIGVYALPSATMSTNALNNTICNGGNITINSGLLAGNFLSASITHAPRTVPASATSLVNAGVSTPATLSGGLDDDGWSGIPVGFNFGFFGTNYSTISVGTNGTLFFGTPNFSDYEFTTLPSLSEPFNMVAVLAMDNNLSGATGGSIKYWTEGYAPNRRFVVSYQAVKEFGDTKYSTAQAIFYETTGIIEVHVTSSTNVDRNKLVGINNSNGTDGVLAYASGTTASTNPQNPISTGFAYRFTPPANYTTQWYANGATMGSSGTNVFSQIGLTPSATTTYSIDYTNQTTGCSNDPANAAITATVRPLFTAGEISSAGETICNAGTPSEIGSSTSASGGDNVITYSWRSSADNYASAISNAASSIYTPPAGLTATTSYRRYAKDGTCNTTPTVSTGTWTVTVRPAFTSGTISSSGETICSGGTPSEIGSSTSASGGDNAITYSWRSSADNYASAISNATSSTYTPLAGLTTTTSYRRYSNDGTCNTTPLVSSGTWAVTVSPIPVAGTVSVNQTICSGNSPANITLTGNTGSLQWQSSSDNISYSDIAATTSLLTSAQMGVLSTNRYYRAVVTSGVCPSAYSNVVTITVNPISSAVFTGVPSSLNLCQGTEYTLTPTTPGGAWVSSDITFLSVTSGGVASIPVGVTVNGLPKTITYTVSNAYGCSSSSQQTVYLRPIPSAPSLTSSQSFCDGATVANLSNVGATSGATLTWYNDNSNANTYSSSINLANGNSYFASQTVNGCESTARAQVVANVDADGTYRSRNTGYWSDATSWNYCADGATYTVSSNAPSNAAVIIQSGHTITGNSAIAASTLNVNATGSMVVASTSTLTVTGGITNNGTFDIQSGGQLVQGTGSTFTSSSTAVSKYTKAMTQIPNTATGMSAYNRAYYIGSPVVGTGGSSLPMAPIVGSSYQTMVSYTESSGTWYEHYVNGSATGSTDNNVFVPGKGYAVNSSPSTLNGPTYFSQAVFNGNAFNNGDVPVTLTNGTGGGFNLVSNPYPSSISWNEVYGSSNNTSLVESTYWLRTYVPNAGMVFQTCNGAGGVSIPSNMSTIAPATAFWVKRTGASGTFKFTNAMRTSGSATYYTMNANHIIRLDLGNGTYEDQAVVYMNEDAGLGIESYDSDKRIPSSTFHQLYSLEGTTKLAINGFNNAIAKDTVLLGMQIPTAGTYTINASQIDATIEEDIFLEDKITGAYQNLKITPSYTFTSTQGTFNNRFVLHFAPFVPALPGQTAATAIAMPTSNWPQCNNVTSEDQWHAFTATSEGISIEVNTASTDIVIELQDGTGNVVAQENAVNGIGNETLNFFGLTAGQIYKVGVRNNISSQPTGTYGICVKSLKRGGCDYGAGPYSLCQYYKATWAGSTGVSYTFTFTGTSGPAAGQTFTRTQNSDICVLSTVTPLLPYGSTYDVVISNTYTLTDGAGNTEQITVPSNNGCQVITIAEPQTTLSNSSSCNNGARFRGAVVSSMPWVCGSNNWRWRFTEVNPLTMQEVGLPIELNRGSASNYLNLGTVAQLQNGKTYAVQTAPMFSYTGTNYNWGPVQYMCIVGVAGMTLEGADAAQGAEQGSTKDALQDASQVDAMVYVTEGNLLNIQLTNAANNTAKRADIYDVTGKLVKSVRLVEGMNQVTLTETAGIYLVRTSVGNQSETTRVFLNN